MNITNPLFHSFLPINVSLI